MASSIIILNFESLFGPVITLTTRFSQPLLGFIFCIFAWWVWRRDALLQELRKGYPEISEGLFWKIWPWYVRLVCPLIILGIFAQTLWG
jgi:NSS family neurotransmitter:Na+ symporter